MIEKVNLAEKLAMIPEPWRPRIVGEVNDAWVKLVTFEGEFVWHSHEAEDELFLVLRGRLRMEFRDGSVHLDEGEMIVVPRGVEHRPVAEGAASVLLFEPKTTVNTGDAVSDRKIESEWI